MQQSRGWVSFIIALLSFSLSLSAAPPVPPSRRPHLTPPPSLQVHYAIHRPEPHILLYRRPKGYGQPQNAVPNAVLAAHQGAAPMVQ